MYNASLVPGVFGEKVPKMWSLAAFGRGGCKKNQHSCIGGVQILLSTGGPAGEENTPVHTTPGCFHHNTGPVSDDLAGKAQASAWGITKSSGSWMVETACL